MKQPEPIQGCLLALKEIIMSQDHQITQQRKFQIPFFYHGDKKLCFLWVTKKKIMMGFIEDKTIHPKKDGLKRKDKMETLLLDPAADIPLKLIVRELKKKIKLYNSLKLS
ncbi:hypothetical protein CNR22_06265 [Sphingobacteriaceae bacterium]|nr:hypothetical protein CNR22_06265 [Sphingobacteriaceae bacterium]